MIHESILAQPTDRCAWDEAFQRVESYLRAFGVESRVQLNTLVTDIISAAQLLATIRPAAEPVPLAMEVADRRIATWFGRVLAVEKSGDQRFQAHGRLAMVLADVPRRWPRSFLSGNSAPDELVTAMRAGSLQAGPEVRFTNMGPSALEFPLAAGSRTARLAFTRGPLLHAAAMWFVIIGLIGVTWAASH